MTDRERFHEKLEEERGDFVENKIQSFADKLDGLKGDYHAKLESQGLSEKEVEERMDEYEQRLIDEAEQTANDEYDCFIEKSMKEYDEEEQ